MRNTTTIFFSALLLASCATVTLDEQGCRNADWVKVGHRDGIGGKPSQVQQHAAQCAPYGVKPDEAKYSAGWADGRNDHATVAAPRNISLF